MEPLVERLVNQKVIGSASIGCVPDCPYHHVLLEQLQKVFPTEAIGLGCLQQGLFSRLCD